MPCTDVAWSSSDDEDDGGRISGERLRRNLSAYASSSLALGQSTGGALSRALRGASESATAASVVAAPSGAEAASDIILSTLDDDELLALRHDVVHQLRDELLISSELESRTGTLLVASARDCAEILRSMNTTVADQARDAAGALDILRASEESIKHLRQGFTDIDRMIGTMQSVESYQRLRELHYFRHNNNSVIQWCRVFVNFEQVDKYEEAIDGAEELTAIYDDLCVMQRVRVSLAGVSSRYRAQISAMRSAFDAADHLIPRFVERIKGIIQNTIRVVLAEHINADEEDDDPALAAAMSERGRALLEEALKIVDRENGHDGDLLKYTGGTGSSPHDPDCGHMLSPLHTEVVESVVSDGTAEVFHTSLMVDANGLVSASVTALVAAIESLVELLPLAEEGILPLRTNLKLTRAVVDTLHGCIMEGTIQFVTECENGSDNITAQDLLHLMHAVDAYREACVDYGGIVSHYTDISDVAEESKRLLDAAVSGLQDHMVTMCESCSISNVNETIRRSQMPDPDMPVAAQDVMSVIDANMKTLATGANLAVLHKLAVATAAALQAFVEDQLSRLDWGKFHQAVADYHEQWVAAREAAAEEGGEGGEEEAAQKSKKKSGGFWSRGKGKSRRGPAAPAAPTVTIEAGQPLEPGSPNVSEAWLVWQCTALNGFQDMKKHATRFERYFAPLVDADEVELSLAGALPSDHEPDDDNPVRWESPIIVVVGDLNAVCESVMSRIVQFICDNEMRKGWDAMFVSPDWQANPTPRPPLNDVFGPAKTAVAEIAPALRDPWSARFDANLVWQVSVCYIELMARFIQTQQKKWLFAKNVDRDIDMLAYFWDSVFDGHPDGLAMSKRVAATLRLILRLMTLSDVDKFTQFVEDEFVLEFADAPEFLPQLLIANRMDLDKKTRERMQHAFDSAWANRPVPGPDAPLSLLASVDEDVVLEGKRGGWFSRAPPKTPTSAHTPGHHGKHQRTFSTSQVISLEGSNGPKGRRKKAASAAPDKKKKGGDPAVISLAEALAAAQQQS